MKHLSGSVIQKFLVPAVLVVIAAPLAGTVFPIFLPILLGLFLAMGAQPIVQWLQSKLHIPHGVAVGIGVSAVIVLSAASLTIISAALLRQLSRLSDLLPLMTDAVIQGTALLEQWLLSLAEKTPPGIRMVVTDFITKLFTGGGSILEQLAKGIPQMASQLLGHFSQGLIATVTMLLSAYMIAARWQELKAWLQKQLPKGWSDRYLPAIKGFRSALGGWLLAQLKLGAVAFFILTIGFLLLKLPQFFLWAALVTLVDALPILGVGTVLVPWSLICFLQQDTPKAIGLLCIFLIIWLVRSILEPRLISKELGLDPLLTLIVIYAGFRLWGIWGMIFAPVIAICLIQLRKQLKS